MSVSLSVQHSPAPVNAALGMAVLLVSGNGTRTFTNKFGQASTVPVILLPVAAAGGSNDNLLYLGSSLPLSTGGIALNMSTPVTLPGHGSSAQYSQLSYYRLSVTLLSPTAPTVTQSYITESGSSRIDPGGSAFLSSVSGFANVTIGGGNSNIGAVQYDSCSAPITFANGQRTPIIAGTFNGAVQVAYSYFISDGATYSITANLILTMDDAVTKHTDALQNQYQQVLNVTGTRVYTYLPTNQTIVSAVSGVNNNSGAPVRRPALLPVRSGGIGCFCIHHQHRAFRRLSASRSTSVREHQQPAWRLAVAAPYTIRLVCTRRLVS